MRTLETFDRSLHSLTFESKLIFGNYSSNLQPLYWELCLSDVRIDYLYFSREISLVIFIQPVPCIVVIYLFINGLKKEASGVQRKYAAIAGGV